MGGSILDALTLALATLRPTNQACFDHRNPLLRVLLPITVFDLYRLEDSHGTAAAAALLALAALPPVLAEAAAAAVLAPAALPPVLADAAAAAILAHVAPPPVRTGRHVRRRAARSRRVPKAPG